MLAEFFCFFVFSSPIFALFPSSAEPGARLVTLTLPYSNLAPVFHGEIALRLAQPPDKPLSSG